ncbi:unnamed protein product [Adineta ricciae]|uniref:DDE-1 domain-containing protein n=1 Tax=Adineta ricciae TaxID=249248 RepID=A0A815UYG1_ADIRI|nr:unnamed protein product [Adineta ricciae]
MSINDDEVHLFPLDGYDAFECSSDDDDSIEVVSNVDEEENNIIDMIKNMQFDSDDESQNNDNNDDIDGLPNDKNNCIFTRDAVVNIRSSFSCTNDAAFDRGVINNGTISLLDNDDLEFSSDDEAFEYYPPNVSILSSSSHSSLIATNDSISSGGTAGNSKRKRRQWSIEEKLRAISAFKLNQSKKRRRVGGAGKKLEYVELDLLLLAWYRKRRTKVDPNCIVPPADTRREKITFKQLQRQGTKISLQLKHDTPSFKWFYRFLTRHRLSLQKPKRQQKISLSEACERVSSFYSYIRRANICNMDESPLALFGDQSKRSINDINTPNDIEGNLSDKRFATLILMVFGEDNSRFGPVLIFKGVINGPVMNEYTKLWWSKVKDAHPKLLIVDSAESHLNEDIINDLRTKRVVVAVVPCISSQPILMKFSEYTLVTDAHYQTKKSLVYH